MGIQSKTRPQPVSRVAVLFADCALMIAGYYIAYAMRFGFPFPKENIEALRAMVPWIGITTAVVFGSVGLYGTPPFDDSNANASVLVSVVVAELVTMAGAYWFRSFAVPRTVFAIVLPVHAVTLMIWRSLVTAVDERRLGDLRYLSIGVEGQEAGAIEHGQIVATIGATSTTGQVQRVLRELEFDAVVLDSAVLNSNKQAMQYLVTQGKQLVILPGAEDIVMASARAGQIDDQPVLLISPLGIGPGQSFNKRALDLLLSVTALVLLSPLMFLTALAVVLLSGFPVFYTQDRLGIHGDVFSIVKFRTMRKGAEADTGPVLSPAGDTRVTAVGRLLRAARLDELPQLVNVLTGDMSMVGPRPERPEIAERLYDTLPEYRFRLLVKPGLTGLAQVRGKYSTRPQDKLLFDLTYIANYSMRMDLMILLRTLAVILTPSKSAGVP